MSDSKSALRALTVGALALAAGVQAHAATLTEGFEVVVPAGWSVKNNSTTVGSTGWFQGNTTVFPAFAGTAASYAGANFNNTTGTGTISNWLIAPTLTFNNGDKVSFYTRTTDPATYPDRLELRFSNVGGTNVGTLPTDVGAFSLLLSVNSALTTTGYPTVWTQFTSTISGLSGPTTGAIAFRYFVTNGGPTGINSDYIGIDSVAITPVPEASTWLMMGLGLSALAAVRRRRA